jgi:hypothetical protein
MSSITKPLFGKRLPFIGELWQDSCSSARKQGRLESVKWMN